MGNPLWPPAFATDPCILLYKWKRHIRSYTIRFAFLLSADFRRKHRSSFVLLFFLMDNKHLKWPRMIIPNLLLLSSISFIRYVLRSAVAVGLLSDFMCEASFTRNSLMFCRFYFSFVSCSLYTHYKRTHFVWIVNYLRNKFVFAFFGLLILNF